MSTIQKALDNHAERLHDTKQERSSYWYLNKLIDDLEELKEVELQNITDAYNAGAEEENKLSD